MDSTPTTKVTVTVCTLVFLSTLIVSGPSVSAITKNCLTTDTDRIRPKAGVQTKTITRSRSMKPARLWIKGARLTPANPRPGSRMTLAVELGYTGNMQSRPFRLILEKAGKRRTQIAAYLWKQGLAPRRRASHRFSLLAPKRAGVKSCYRVSLKPMARQRLLVGPAKQLCVTTAGTVRSRQISQRRPMQTTRVRPDSGPCRDSMPTFSGHGHDSTVFQNGSTVAVAGVNVGQVTQHNYIPGVKVVQLKVTLNYNLLLPGDAVAMNTGGTPHGWANVNAYSSTGITEPIQGIGHSHPVIQAGGGTTTLTTSILCRPGLLATDAKVKVRMGFWKSCSLKITRPLVTPVSKSFDYNSICQAALAGS